MMLSRQCFSLRFEYKHDRAGAIVAAERNFANLFFEALLEDVCCQIMGLKSGSQKIDPI